MSKPAVRRLFLAAFVLLPVQYALVGIVGLRASEPWPALVMPGFQRVWGAAESFTVPRVRLEATFADGTRAEVPTAVFLGDLPRTHHRAVLDEHFRPASLSGTPETERVLAPESVGWVRGRLGTLFAGRRATRLDVVWEELTFRPAAGRAPVAATPLDTLAIPLR